MRQLEATGEKLKFGFIKSVVAELRKVAWPSRQEAIRLTAIVLAVTIVIAAILWVVDTAFTELVDWALIH